MKASDILSSQDLKTKVVEVEDWGCSLTVRELSLSQGLEFFQMAQGETLSGLDVAKVVSWGVIDEKGKRVFSDDDVPALAEKSKKPLLFLYQEIVGLSGDDAEKN